MEKNQFIIFADVPPEPSEEGLIKYKEAGFNYYNLTEDYIVRDGADGKITDEYYKAIDDCHRHGLKVILRTMRSNSPDYYDAVGDEFAGKADGYYMADEPSYTYVDWYGSPPIEKLKKVVKWYNAHGGDTYFHINLLQSYGMGLVHGSEAPDYETYVDAYIKEVLSEVKGEKSLSTDHYPLAHDEVNYIKGTVLYDYFVLADRAKKLREQGHSVRTCFCIQLTSDEGLKIRELECPADVTFQTNLALAFGAKSFEYFLYVGENTGLIPDKKNQTVYNPAYEWVKEANRRLHELGNYYLGYEWKGVRLYVGKTLFDERNARAFEAVKERQTEKFVALTGFESSADAVVGEFEKSGENAYMAVNYTEPTANVQNTVTFTFEGYKNALVIKGGTMQKVSLPCGRVAVSLSAGEGVFVIPEK